MLTVCCFLIILPTISSDISIANIEKWKTIEMPGDSALVMRGKISNMPKDISEFISRTGYTDFENIRSFNEYCNFHGWASSLESMQKAYEDWKADNE